MKTAYSVKDDTVTGMTEPNQQDYNIKIQHDDEHMRGYSNGDARASRVDVPHVQQVMLRRRP
jgi:hypothetical protein